MTLSSSDSESDDDLARLREAVDCDTLRENLYSKEANDAVPDKNCNNGDTSLAENDNERTLKNPYPIHAEDNPKSMSESIKAIIKANSTKVKVAKVPVETLSLRRDRQDDSKPLVMSELEVTPQFQKFVGTKLDDFLGKQIKDVVKEKVEVAAADESELKLLKRSKVGIKEDVESNIKRPRPELLSHRTVELSSEDLSTCAVTGDFVLSKVEVGGWVNKFAGRVEEGTERIKKKKKKVKKKKSKDPPTGAVDKIANGENVLNESEKVV
eukprot:TRINITY_DN17448_c0_g1_i1.p1 TRINITY_DN17448_c0_g1~~TRINITY_DN17448_c0_g1_i1.p1  ORF type:complete len:268 (-),score=94.60 TRINITY_DN17448_c0_g1_i1:42-845(-)